MPLSKYCKIYPQKDTPGFVLFSTKKASIISVPGSLIEDIEKDNLAPDERETLRELGFLTDNADEEKNEMLHIIEELRGLNKKLDIIAVMDLDCNLACTYCFEGQRKGKHFMSGETADALVKFAVETASGKGLEAINIIFYGGEPLLNSSLIMRISEKLKALAGDSGLIYTAAMITNGTLLTPGMAGKLKPLGLAKAGVTLDGPKDIHDKFRPFKSGKGSFDVIAGNVKEVCDKIEVHIGGNFTEENYREFPRLLDHLAKNGVTQDKVAIVRFDPVINEQEGIAPPDFHDGCSTVNEPWITEATVYLREEILKRGYKTGKVVPSTCMVEFSDKIVVNYNGDIYKCPGLIGREELKVGNISTGITDHRQSHNLDNWKNDECLDCAYLPLCFGGCRYMKLVRDGNMTGVDCKKPYLDAVLEQLVMQDIKYGVKS